MQVRILCVLALLLLMPATLFSNGNNSYDRGYHPTVEAGLLLNRNVVVASALTSQGYCFGNGLYVGGVTGIMFGSVAADGGRAELVPLLADVKYSFLDRKASPFVELRTGTVLDLSSDGFIGGVGFMLRPSLGVDIMDFSISIGLNLQTATYASYSSGSASLSGRGKVFFPGFTPGYTGNSGIYIGLAYYF